LPHDAQPNGLRAADRLPDRGSALLLLFAVLVLFLSIWIVLPPFNAGLILFAAAAPEVSPLLFVAAALVAIFAAARVRRHRRAVRALLISLVAAALAISPMARAPFVIRSFDRAMRDALGPTALDDAAAGQPQLRTAPLRVRDIFLGMQTRRDVRVRRAVRFASHDGVDLTTDIYQPSADGRYPAIVQIYGGAWQRGEPGNYGRSAAHLASLGYVVFAIDYRHAPRWRWPAQLADVRAALRWIRDHGPEYGADTSRAGLIGRSAGGQLALIAAYDAPDLPVKAVVSLYGPTDLEDGYRHPPSPDPLDVRAILRSYLGNTPDLVPDRYRDASPIAKVGAASPPTLLIYGARDHIVLPRYGAMLHDRLRQAGVPSVFLEIPWAEHAFDAVPNGPSAQMALYYIERFFARTLKPGA
jgi:acetyl esterase/lipase